MKELGIVEGVSASGKFIVRASGKIEVRINRPVFSRDGNKVGVIFDVIGPVARPWVLVDAKGLSIGQKVYLR